MECKLSSSIVLERFVTELIDTLWNVNSNHKYDIQDYDYELIDTLWNVNVQ